MKKNASYSLIDELLAQQGRLTAVERFAQKHDGNIIPLHEKFYRDFIPLSVPRPGEQFAFEVNLDACSGCKACVTACHNLNGLDEGETWREVGALQGGLPIVHQTITSACHHCLEPGCLTGCPVEAYEKNSVTGIVRHLDDQCIGCQYCTMMCPYEVPKYSAKRGIVRKCDMCQSRLSEGEAPACVQSCPNGAIAITIVNKHEAGQRAACGEFLPDTPTPTLTRPTTRYRSIRPLPNDLKGVDHYELRPAAAHPPLIFMLVITQLSIGLFTLNYFLGLFFHVTRSFAFRNSILAGIAGLVGLMASVLHLGRPLHAWRAFLGWKTSWLSREIMVFGGFSAAAACHVASRWMATSLDLTDLLGTATVVTGAAGVGCSVMVYHVTGREYWKFSFTAMRFYGTALVLGCAALWTTAAIEGASAIGRAFAILLLLSMAGKLGFEFSVFTHLRDSEFGAMKRSALLLRNALYYRTNRRFLFGVTGGFLLPLIYLVLQPTQAIAFIGGVFCLIGELLERSLFFESVAPARMPKGA